MTNILTIIKKELKHYFNSPMAYIIIVAFLLISSFLYWFTGGSFIAAKQASLRNYYNVLPFLLLFIIPLITMRLLAEEKQQGTLELMVTLPLTDSQIILGKFFGAVAFYAVLLASTLPYPLVVSSVGALDWGAVIGSYLGIFLMGAGIIALGLFISSLTNNQLISAVVSMIISLGLFYLGYTGNFLPASLGGLFN
ncbi:MAG TPA: ABC transporter permease, partial [bacterium]|nr:ABC transporter permease [bacterium]